MLRMLAERRRRSRVKQALMIYCACMRSVIEAMLPQLLGCAGVAGRVAFCTRTEVAQLTTKGGKSARHSTRVSDGTPKKEARRAFIYNNTGLAAPSAACGTGNKNAASKDF
jgi:hypothetical protein